MTRLLNKVAGLEWRGISNNLLGWRHPGGSESDTHSTARFPQPDPRTNRRDWRRGAGFGLEFYEGREWLCGIYEDMRRECVWMPCPEQTRSPRINCSIALGGKASDGSAGPLIRARGICDSRHRRATVKWLMCEIIRGETELCNKGSAEMRLRNRQIPSCSCWVLFCFFQYIYLIAEQLA